jgi:hypothetical protein
MQVKKTIVILFLAGTTGLSAQSPLRLGAHIDPIITWFSPRSSEIAKDGARLGYNGGLIVEYYFARNYAFATGLSLTSLGGNLLYKERVTITAGGHDVLLPANTTVSFNMNYITIPAGLKLKSNEIGFLTYYAELGFTPQINIGSRASSTGGLIKKQEVSSEIKLFNLSYFFGGGVEYNLGGQTSLVAGIFFNNGFADVLSASQHKASLNFLTFRIGMMF